MGMDVSSMSEARRAICMRVSPGSGSWARNASMRALALSAVKGVSSIRLMQVICDPANTICVVNTRP